MPFQNSNGFNQNASSGEKKKTNFPVGKLYGTNGIMNISIWNSDSAVYTILTIKQTIGKDPSTGQPAYEQKAPNELPRVFLNAEFLRLLVEGMRSVKMESDSFTISPKHGTKLTIATNNHQVELTIETEKQGKRAITFNATPIGSANVNAQWINMGYLLDLAMKKALYAKIDPEEFATALSGYNTTTEEEVPI